MDQMSQILRLPLARHFIQNGGSALLGMSERHAPSRRDCLSLFLILISFHVFGEIDLKSRCLNGLEVPRQVRKLSHIA